MKLVHGRRLNCSSNVAIGKNHLQVTYQKARHQIEIIKEKGKRTHWQAANPNNHLSVDFDGKGLLVHSLRDDWHLSMELVRLGEPDQLKPINQPSVQIKDNRLTYDRGTIKEWYINDPKGLEQGFTLNKPLAKEQLILEFALDDDVKPNLMDKGAALELTISQGKKLRYEGLKAWDAKDRSLNATLQLKENTMQLQVAVIDAAYPITIDPWLVEEQKLTASAKVARDLFGGSVAISGDTVIVGAHLDDDGGNDSRAAYIFTHVGNGDWLQQTKLLASDPSWDDRFG
jgi:hypothetical protein